MTHEGFWQSILADPDSDTPRLVYADWLEEQGEAERAEFIRVQIELAKMSEDDPRCAELTARQTALLPFQLQALRLGNSPAWPRKMPRWALNSSPVFQRGFVEEIYCTAAQLIDGAEGLFRAAPVRVLGVRNARERVAALAQVPQLRQIVSLELDGQKLGWETTALWASPHLTRLRRLDLRGTRQRVAEAEALAQWPGASELEWLDLSDNQIRDSGTEVLVASLRSVREMELRNVGMGPRGARALASAGLRSLILLDLADNSMIADTGAAALAGGDWPALKTLDLSSCDVTIEGARLLVESPALDGLEVLRLVGNWVGTELILARRERFGRRVQL